MELLSLEASCIAQKYLTQWGEVDTPLAMEYALAMAGFRGEIHDK